MNSKHRLQPSKLSPDALDAQYNNRALVPDFGRYFARWQADSAAVRGSMACALDVPYLPADPTATLDVFKADRANAPVVFFIHGGYWRALDKSDHSFIAAAFPGTTCVIPNYALCPGTEAAPVTIARIALQMVAAHAWVVRHIAEHGGNPKRIVVAGHSAGGHLAAMLMAANPKALGSAVMQAVSISGLFELATIARVPFLQADLRISNEDAQRCSPAWMPAPAGGELACFVGEAESAEFRRHNRMMRTAWGATRVPIVQELDGANHFSALDALCDPRSALHTHVMQITGP